MFRKAMLAASAAASLCAPAWADDKPKAPEAIQVQPEAEDPAKFFVFHAEGVSFDTAKADYMFCIEQARGVLSLRDKIPQQGLLQALINGRMAEIDRFRMRNAIMRKCMGLIGYQRYQLSAAAWKVIVKEGDLVLANDGSVDDEVVGRLARIASGPTPTSPRLDQ